jgi:hypothetical protein
MRRTEENHKQSRYSVPERDLILEPPEYEAGAITMLRKCLNGSLSRKLENMGTRFNFPLLCPVVGFWGQFEFH